MAQAEWTEAKAAHDRGDFATELRLYRLLAEQASQAKAEFLDSQHPEAPDPGTAPPARASEHPWQVLVGAAADGPACAPFHFSTNTPPADWTAETFDDHGSRAGYCLYKVGCRGPTTYNACSTTRWLSR